MEKLSISEKLEILKYEKSLLYFCNVYHNLKTDNRPTDSLISEIIERDYRACYQNIESAHYSKETYAERKKYNPDVQWFIGDALYEPFLRLIKEDISLTLLEEIERTIRRTWIDYLVLRMEIPPEIPKEIIEGIYL